MAAGPTRSSRRWRRRCAPSASPSAGGRSGGGGGGADEGFRERRPARAPRRCWPRPSGSCRSRAWPSRCCSRRWRRCATTRRRAGVSAEQEKLGSDFLRKRLLRPGDAAPQGGVSGAGRLRLGGGGRDRPAGPRPAAAAGGLERRPPRPAGPDEGFDDVIASVQPRRDPFLRDLRSAPTGSWPTRRPSTESTPGCFFIFDGPASAPPRPRPGSPDRRSGRRRRPRRPGGVEVRMPPGRCPGRRRRRRPPMRPPERRARRGCRWPGALLVVKGLIPGAR